jgi:hypothetical protein
MAKVNRRYARVSWSIEDIHERREDGGMERWTDKQAHGFLRDYENSLQDVMVSAAGEHLSDLLEFSGDDDYTDTSRSSGRYSWSG